MGSTLLQFAQTNDSAAATPKKLAKQQILAEYFRSLEDDDDLRRAVRYAAGRPFAATDERTLNVGWSTLGSVAQGMLRVDSTSFRDTVIRSGEMGEALARLWSKNTTESTAPLALADLGESFDALASTGNGESKRQILAALLARCHAAREVAYLTKIIFGDMRTGVQEGVLAAAIAHAFEREAPAVTRAQLLVGDLGEVAVLARHDALASAKFKLFHPIQFMLATPQETAADAVTTMAGRAFIAEDKLDGIRAQIHKTGDGDSAKIAIYTRTMDRTDESFPDVADAAKKLPGEFLLDGEIVPYRNGVVLPFANIQKRLGRKSLTQKVLKDHPAAFIAFDILYRDGELLMDRPLQARRAALEQLAGVSPYEKPTGDIDAVAATPPSPRTRGEGKGEGDFERNTAVDIQNHPHPNPLPAYGEREQALLITTPTVVITAEQIDAAFARSRQSRNEGLVLKDLQSIYSPGRRGQMWLKLKTHLPTLDCVVTFAEYGHGKRRNSLSDYTFAVWDRDPAEEGATLVNVGKAYSGVTDEEIARLTTLFLELALDTDGRVYRVEPKVVFEIAADQIQKSTRHASGYALRFPRIKRIRWDKNPPDADRLSRVVEIYESQHNFGRSDPTPEPPPEPTLFDDL